MTSPYVITELEAVIALKPSQMNNEKNKKILDNLIKYYEGHCYKNFGFIKKIYGITHISSGKIIAENPTGEAVYNVRFKCKLCNPIESKEIICELEKIIIGSEQLFALRNSGSIITIVRVLNESGKFYINRQKMALMYRDKSGVDIEIKEKTFIKVLIIKKSMMDRCSTIHTIGMFTDIANDKEIEEYYRYENDDREMK